MVDQSRKFWILRYCSTMKGGMSKEVAREINANAVSVYVDAIKSESNLKTLIKESRCVLAARSQGVIAGLLKMEGADDRVIKVPYMRYLSSLCALCAGVAH